MSEFKDRSYADEKIPVDPDRCYYCKVKLDPYDSHEQDVPTVDHVKPRSAGGILSKKNKVYCCGKCNRIKGKMSPEAFMKFLVAYESAKRLEFNKEMAWIKTVKKSLHGLFAIKRKNRKK